MECTDRSEISKIDFEVRSKSIQNSLQFSSQRFVVPYQRLQIIANEILVLKTETGAPPSIVASNGTSQPRTYAPDFSTRYQPFFGVALFQTEAQKRGRSFLASQTERSETRSSIFPNFPFPSSIHPKPLDIYRSAKVLSAFFGRTDNSV